MSLGNPTSSIVPDDFCNVQSKGKIDPKSLDSFYQHETADVSTHPDLFGGQIRADVSGDPDLDGDVCIAEQQGLLQREAIGSIELQDSKTFSTIKLPSNAFKPNTDEPKSTINLQETKDIEHDSKGKRAVVIQTDEINYPADANKCTSLHLIKRGNCKLVLTVIIISTVFLVISVFISPFVGRLEFYTTKGDKVQDVHNYCAIQTKIAKFKPKTDMILNTAIHITWELFGPRKEFVQLNETRIIAKENGTYLITVSLTLDGNTCKGNGYMTLRCIRNSVSETEKCAGEQLAPNITRTVEITDVISLSIGDYVWISGFGFDCICTGDSFNSMTITKRDVVCH